MLPYWFHAFPITLSWRLSQQHNFYQPESNVKLPSSFNHRQPPTTAIQVTNKTGRKLQQLIVMAILLSDPFPPPLQVEMKTFLDPMGLFVIQIPKQFFALRRSSQGDLPDAKGQGRRGSSIFTAGDLAKAEVIAVERFPIQGLLEENGIMVGEGAGGGLTTFGDIGKPSAVANLLNQHRERSRPGQSMAVLVPDSWTLSPNGKELEFMVKAEIDVQKPDLLLEQYGISRLFRVTVAKASLESNDGNVTAVFCSALEQDYQGPDGEALRAAAKSFRALDQSTVAAKT